MPISMVCFWLRFDTMKTRKMLKCVLILGLLLLGFVLYCNIRIVCFSKTRLFDSVDDVPHRHAALVLGTSPTGSGDNRHVMYNEAEAM